MRGFLWLQDADVVENTPTNIVYYYGCCATSGCVFTHPMEPRKGSSDIRSHPVAMLLLLRKKRGKKPGMCRTYFRSGPLPDRASYSHVTGVTSVQNTLLGWIWGNFRLCMRRTYFRTITNVTSGHMTDVTSGHVTSGHVTSGSTSQHLRKY